MKKSLLTLFSLALAVSAHATSYTFADADYFGGKNVNNTPKGQKMSAVNTATTKNSVSGTFDIVPLTLDGTANFTILGSVYLDQPPTTTYSSTLGFVPNGPITILNGFVKFFFRDIDGANESFTISLPGISRTETSFSTYLSISQGASVNIITALNATGNVTYTVNRTSGNFVFDAAYLQVNATPDGGSTLALLGSVLMVGAVLRRKLALA